MLYACTVRFDVMGNFEKFLGHEEELAAVMHVVWLVV